MQISEFPWVIYLVDLEQLRLYVLTGLPEDTIDPVTMWTSFFPGIFWPLPTTNFATTFPIAANSFGHGHGQVGDVKAKVKWKYHFPILLTPISSPKPLFSQF